MRKIMMNNIYAGPTYAIDGGRLKSFGFLRYDRYAKLKFPIISATRCFSDYTNRPLETSNITISASDSSIQPLSDIECKEKKAQVLKNLPAVFEDMSKLKQSGYFAITNFRKKPLSYYSLVNTPGIYLITNNISKKLYVGMSKDLKGRFYNYLDLNRLNQDKSPRINKALIKYGYQNFSISILEFHEKTVKNSFLREREDFFIRVFKPQYNIKRSKFNLDLEFANNSVAKAKIDIPLKIKNLLDKCLDQSNLDYNLIHLKYSSRKNYYILAFSTPKYFIKANSLG
jgi:group I intron endonuclease